MLFSTCGTMSITSFFFYENEIVSIAPSYPRTEFLISALLWTIPWLLLQLVIIPNFISYPFFESYRKLVDQEAKEDAELKASGKKRRKPKNSVVWNNFILSTIHAVYAFAMSAIILFGTNEFPTPSVLKASLITSRLLMICVGYFFTDFILGFKYGILTAEAYIHHIIVISSMAFLLSYWNFHLVGISTLLTEFTTPFINNRWLLEKMGMKEYRIYLFNGLVIWFGWMLFRLPLSIWLLYLLYYNFEHVVSTIPYFPTFFIVLQSSLLCLLNFFWFYKITKGIVRVVFAKEKKE